MKMTEVELFEEALVQLAKILEYSKRNLEDEVVIDAIALRLATMIDTLSRLPSGRRCRCGHVPPPVSSSQMSTSAKRGVGSVGLGA